MAARGRHRRNRPSTVSRASLRVTAGGAGLAIPLIGAHFAYAAPEDVWQKVAACESGGRWDVNTGNGFYGGLQFTQSTWQAYGGTAYAPRADLAGKNGQIAVAEKVLTGQGPRAWPHCGPRAGLSPGSGSGTTGHGATQRAKAPEPAEAPAPAAGPVNSPPEEASPGRSRTRDDGQDRVARAARARADRAKQTTTYQVISGDNLSEIADSAHLRGGWQGLYTRNRKTVGGDPDLIRPGERLHLDRTAGTAARKAKPEATSQTKPASRTKPEATSRNESRTKPESRPRTEPESAPGSASSRAAARSAPRTARASSAAASVEAPVSGYSPSTPYRSSGSSWSSGHHTGVDFPVPTGTAVKAVRGGTVVSAGWGGAYGYQVVLRHGDGKYSQYGHLSAISVRAGQSVGAGRRIARSGATGNATGPHLHFEIRTGPGYGTDVDPLGYLRAHGVRV